MNAARLHKLARESRDRAFSLALRSSFESMGLRSRLSLPIQIEGARQIALGNHVYLGPGCLLLAHDTGGRLEIGDGTSVNGYCVFSAAASVRIGRNVLFARNVYVADHRHRFDRADQPVLEQGIEDLRPVHIEDGAWLGQNVVILPGVTVGAGAVIGAGSIVRYDIPPRCVAVGSPARVVRELDGNGDRPRLFALGERVG